MRSVFVLSSLFAASASTSAVEALWAGWKATNGKLYASQTEEARRMAYFEANIVKIAELNAAKNGATFAANKFADRSPSELSAMLGLRLPADAREGVAIAKVPRVVADDSKVDWRTSGIVAPIQDQGACGSCWAFSAAINIETRYALAKNRTNFIKISEQALVDCDHLCGQYRDFNGCDGGCNGGLMPNAYKYVQQSGIPLQADYAYTARDGTCKSFTRSEVTVSGWEFIDTNEDAIQQYVAAKGPVSIAVDASSWSFYSGGIMKDVCRNTQFRNLNHGVAIVGFDNDTDGTPFWIVRNSWGLGWGESGYLRIIRNTNQCGVNYFACSALP